MFAQPYTIPVPEKPYPGIHAIVYQHITYTADPSGRFRQQVEEKAIVCPWGKGLGDMIDNLRYFPVLDCYVVSSTKAGTYEFLVVLSDTADR